MHLFPALQQFSFEYARLQFNTSRQKQSKPAHCLLCLSVIPPRYGDRATVSSKGRLFAVLWILYGIVIIAITMAMLTTALTKITLESEPKLYGSKVGSDLSYAQLSMSIKDKWSVYTIASLLVSNNERCDQALKAYETQNFLASLFGYMDVLYINDQHLTFIICIAPFL